MRKMDKRMSRKTPFSDNQMVPEGGSCSFSLEREEIVEKSQEQEFKNL